MTRFRPEFVRLWHDAPVSLPRLLLVHGSVVNGEATWAAQLPLGERFELVVPNRRGFPPGPDVESVGAHSEPFDIVCDVLESRLGAERAVLPGAGHSVQRLGEPFNDLLAAFVTRSCAADRRPPAGARSDSRP